MYTAANYKQHNDHELKFLIVQRSWIFLLKFIKTKVTKELHAVHLNFNTNNKSLRSRKRKAR